MTGTANTQQEIDQAIAIAKNTEGVKMVKSRPQGPEGQVIPGSNWAPGKNEARSASFFLGALRMLVLHRTFANVQTRRA